MLVDTSVWIEFHRRSGRAEVKMAVLGLLKAFEATICGPVEMEFMGGALPHELPKMKADWAVLLYLRNDQKIWRKAADLYSQLRRKGLGIPWNDALIASLALEAKCRVYALDKHFTAMAPHVGLRLYEPGLNGAFNPGTEPS